MVPKQSQNGPKEGPDALWNRVWARERCQGQLGQQNFGHFGAKIGPKSIQKLWKFEKIPIHEPYLISNEFFDWVS